MFLHLCIVLSSHQPRILDRMFARIRDWLSYFVHSKLVDISVHMVDLLMGFRNIRLGKLRHKDEIWGHHNMDLDTQSHIHPYLQQYNCHRNTDQDMLPYKVYLLNMKM